MLSLPTIWHFHTSWWTCNLLELHDPRDGARTNRATTFATKWWPNCTCLQFSITSSWRVHLERVVKCRTSAMRERPKPSAWSLNYKLIPILSETRTSHHLMKHISFCVRYHILQIMNSASSNNFLKQKDSMQSQYSEKTTGPCQHKKRGNDTNFFLKTYTPHDMTSRL